ncbi:hypothetical protein B0H15DRAFT_184778 [Mycena belliarum]|uniref:Uncharacterized protein n=1 Tax=Mycena belliarum TaxID=1033014 RepID=A0AAD6U7N0_9AGAR|nr:hypothetical protein B0H15DRAFT_184778 [Mycena belliae]
MCPLEGRPASLTSGQAFWAPPLLPLFICDLSRLQLVRMTPWSPLPSLDSRRRRGRRLLLPAVVANSFLVCLVSCDASTAGCSTGRDTVDARKLRAKRCRCRLLHRVRQSESGRSTRSRAGSLGPPSPSTRRVRSGPQVPAAHPVPFLCKLGCIKYISRPPFLRRPRSVWERDASCLVLVHGLQARLKAPILQTRMILFPRRRPVSSADPSGALVQCLSGDSVSRGLRLRLDGLDFRAQPRYPKRRRRNRAPV